jgi:hypothetical protein
MLVIATILLYLSTRKSAISTGDISAATRDGATATQELARESRRVLEEEWRPRLVVYFDVPIRGCNYAYVAVKNLGRLPAEDVRLTFDPKLEGVGPPANRTQISDMVPMLKDGIKTLPPGLVMRSEIAPLDMYFRQYREEIRLGTDPLSYEVTIEYRGGISEDPVRNKHKDQYRISLFDWMMIESARPNTIDDLVQSMEDISWTLKHPRPPGFSDKVSSRDDSKNKTGLHLIRCWPFKSCCSIHKNAAVEPEHAD